MDDIRVLLFLHIVQPTLIVYVGLALFDIDFPVGKSIKCGIILGICVWLLRGLYMSLGIPFGTHTLVISLLFILVLKYLGGQNWGIAVGATLVPMTLVTIGGGVSQAVIDIFGWTGSQILANPWLHILVGYAESSFLVVMLLLNKIFGFTIVNFLDIR